MNPTNQDFKYITKDIVEEKKRLAENRISLNKKLREVEVSKEEKEAKARKG